MRCDECKFWIQDDENEPAKITRIESIVPLLGEEHRQVAIAYANQLGADDLVDNYNCTGECHRYPPSIAFPEMSDTDNYFPMTRCCDWCGEFQPKESEPDR